MLKLLEFHEVKQNIFLLLEVVSSLFFYIGIPGAIMKIQNGKLVSIAPGLTNYPPIFDTYWGCRQKKDN